MPDSVELICLKRPPSKNNPKGKGAQDFARDLCAAFKSLRREKMLGVLYGLVIWFVVQYNSENDLDADNISNKVWDVLNDADAYQDDRQVRLRTAMIFDLAPGDTTSAEIFQLNLTQAPVPLLEALNVLIEEPRVGARQHGVTFVRFGTLGPDMIEDALQMGQT